MTRPEVGGQDAWGRGWGPETYGGETGDVDARQVCGYAGRGLVGLAEPVKASVGDGDSRFLGRVVSTTRDVAGRRRVERVHIPRG